jgi:hypothetical protein
MVDFTLIQLFPTGLVLSLSEGYRTWYRPVLITFVSTFVIGVFHFYHLAETIPMNIQGKQLTFFVTKIRPHFAVRPPDQA